MLIHWAFVHFQKPGNSLTEATTLPKNDYDAADVVWKEFLQDFIIGIDHIDNIRVLRSVAHPYYEDATLG